MNTYLNDLFGLDGKSAVVIGGGGHLCGEMARGFAKAGCDVAVVDWTPEKAKAVADELRGYDTGVKVIEASIDATDKDAHQELLTKCVEAFGKVDILVNGAGINAPTPILDISAEEFRKIVDSHLTATLFGCQVFGAHMLERGKGSIINLSSASAGPPLSKAFTYSAAKAGVMNLTQNIAREWAPRGVRVNGLRPGFFPTDWSLKHFIDDQRRDAILGHTPMGRFGTPAELVGCVLWLASDASGFVTGAQMAVDGGFTCMTI